MEYYRLNKTKTGPRRYGYARGLFFHESFLFFQGIEYLYGFNDRLCSSLDTKLAAVNAEAVARCRAPLLVCVIIVIAGTTLVCFVDNILGLFHGLAVFLGDTVDPPVKVCVNEYAEAVF